MGFTMLSDELPPLLGYIEGVRLRDAGMLQAATASVETEDWLSRARAVAKHLAAKNSEVCVEDLYGIVGLPPNPNAAGSIFKGKEWKCIGIRQAVRAKRHAGTIRRWSLV
jgi:hypothetical protein